MNKPDDICSVPFIGDIINSNFNISEQILDAYYRQIPQPANKNEVSSSYLGKINRHNSPHQVSVYGAYPIMTQWEMLDYKMNHCDDDYYKAYQRDTVFEYLKEFAKGFQYGYDNFINDKITDSHLLSLTETSKAQAIMDFLSSPFDSFGFSESHGGSRHLFSGWYVDGIKAGYNYCAWIIIFKNHKLFEPFFKIAPVIQVEDLRPETKKALVIGCSKYLHATSLANPLNDANGMELILKKLGFDVFKIIDPTQKELKIAIDEFGINLKGSDIGLLYFAGHGVQVKGLNYLIPSDANLTSEKIVEYDCVEVGRVLAQMEEAKTNVNIIILDACRNNPFERSWGRGINQRGLAIMRAPKRIIDCVLNRTWQYCFRWRWA